MRLVDKIDNSLDRVKPTTVEPFIPSLLPFLTICLLTFLFCLYRCKSFQNCSRSEVCQIQGVTISNESDATIVRWPGTTKQALQNVLYYVYTGQVLSAFVSVCSSQLTILLYVVKQFQMNATNDIFAVITLACQLGLDELVGFAGEYMQDCLSVHSVNVYLEATLQLKRRLSGQYK